MIERLKKDIKSFTRTMIDRIAVIVEPRIIVEFEARIRFKKSLDIRHPQKLSEKLCFLEYYGENELKVKCSDKYDVRSFVESKGLTHILVPLAGGPYSNSAEIEFERYPKKFVVKATFGCKMNYICLDKSPSEIQKIKKAADKWLKKGFERRHLEPHYGKLQRRLIAECYLEVPDGIMDYKFHCFHGKPEFCLVCSDRGDDGSLKLNLYDMDWKPIHEICGIHKTDSQVSCPSKLGEMIKICEKLSEDFDFVRVDLYQVDDKVYFSELTFTPDGGILSYYTDKFDRYAGNMLHLEILDKI